MPVELSPVVENTMKRTAAIGYEYVVDLFRSFDSDKDGRLTYKELTNLFLSLNPKWEETMSLEVVAAASVKGKGFIDCDEFIKIMFPRASAMGGSFGLTEHEKVLELFRYHDRNRNGRLDKNEFTDLMKCLKGSWRLADTDKIFAQVDADSNGEVDCGELISWLFQMRHHHQVRPKTVEAMARRQSISVHGGEMTMRPARLVKDMPPEDPAGARLQPPNGTAAAQYPSERSAGGSGGNRRSTLMVAQEPVSSLRRPTLMVPLEPVSPTRRPSIAVQQEPMPHSGRRPSAVALQDCSPSAVDPLAAGSQRRKSVMVQQATGEDRGLAPGVSSSRRLSRPQQGRNPEVLTVVVHAGKRAKRFVELFAEHLDRAFHGSVGVESNITSDTATVSRVDVKGGKVVFWDRASMIAFREDPFIDIPQARKFLEELEVGQISQLLRSL